MPAITKTFRSGIPIYSYRQTSTRYTGITPLYPWFKSVVSWADTRTGINLPGWRDKIRNRNDATTSFSGTKSSVTVKPGSYDVSYTESVPPYGNIVRTYTFEGLDQPPFFQNSIIGTLAAAEQLALIQLYKNIRKNHQKFSSLTFLGELRQAVRMVRRPAETLRKGLDSYILTLKKRSRGIPMNSKGNAVRKKVLADTWLEYSFGWIPLISDVQSGAEALAAWHVGRDGLDERRQRISATGRARDASKTTSYQNPDPYYTKVNHVVTNVSEGERQVRYIVRLAYLTAVPKESARRLAQLSGFSLMEFVPTAWELLPWSFLIDYFSNIGDVLEAWSTPTDNIYSITKTIRSVYLRSYERRIDLKPTSSGAGFVGLKESGYGTGSWISNRTDVSREPVLTLSLPRLEIENPFGKNRFARSANMAALAASARSLKPFYR